MFRKAAGLDVAVALTLAFAGLVSWSISASSSKAQEAPTPRSTEEGTADKSLRDGPGQEVLNYGPVHEAFAQPTALDPQPPMIVPKAAPAPVLETPPKLKPQGESVAWIPGYWAWEDHRQDFIWVSGIWRDPPPNHAWFAGYWTPAKDGYQWAPGIWAPANAEQAEYVPEPPKSSEEGPKTAAPTPNHFWIQGNYEYFDSRFAWRPGHWAAAQPGWIWTGARYEWTPHGYLFLKGHWDYELSQRGTLFAPVAFKHDHWGDRPIKYSPMVMIDPGSLTTDFFVRPSYYHYYFGDMYGPEWASRGVHPWFDDRGGDDPIFAYYRWHHTSRDPEWAARLKERYAHMDHHPEERPNRLYEEPTGTAAPGGRNVGISMEEYARRPGTARFQTVSVEERKEFAEQAVLSKEVALQRASAEAHLSEQPGAGHRSPDIRANQQAVGTYLPLPSEGPRARPSSPVAGRSFDENSRAGAGSTQHAGLTAGPSKSAFRPWVSASPATGTRANTGTVTTQAAHQGTTPARTPPPTPKK